MVRFFTETQNISDSSIKMNKEDSEHIRVLRLRPDEQFIVCDGNGIDYVCCLGERGDHTTVNIISQQRSIGEPSLMCKVFIAFQKGDRLDYAVQKSVELGAHEIVLFESGRCIAIPHDLHKKTERLQRIALETAKQCNRGIIPKVSSGGNFDTVVNEVSKCSGVSLLFYESEEYLHLKKVLEENFLPMRESEEYKIKTISIVTGPEGGFEPHEIELARSKDIKIVSLGSRILRSETAPVVALAAIMYHTGNL